jgi:hypothetical protein
MGHFSIRLGDHFTGEVRFGKISKKFFSVRDLFRKRRETDTKCGYIVEIQGPEGEKLIYRQLKSLEGEWLSENIPGFPIDSENKQIQEIRAAIDLYESSARTPKKGGKNTHKAPH